MARSWVKLEDLKALWDQHDVYRRQLVQLEIGHPQHRENILAPLSQRNEVLEGHTRHLYSIAESRYYVGGHLQGNRPNPLESDDRFDLEMSLKNALYPAIHQFEVDFKVVKEAFEDPMGSIKKFEGHLDAANKNNLALEKQLDSASKEICYLQRQNEKLEQGMRDLTDDFAKEADDCLQAQQEVVVLKNECATLEGRINDLDSRVEEQNKEITRILDQNSKLQKFQDQQKNVQLINHGEDLTISEKNKTIVALTQQLRDACENEESVRKILVMDKDRNTNLKKDVKEWKQRNQGLVDENNAFRRQIIEFKAQLRRAQSSNTHIAPRQGVSAGSIPNNSISRSSGSEALPQQGFSMGSVQSGSTARSPIAEVSREQAMANLRAFSNNPNTPPRQSSHSSSMGNRNLSEASPSSAIRQSSTTSPSSVRRASFTATSSRSRVRDAPTATQADFIRRVRRLRDDQLQNLAEAFDEVRTIQPGEGVHWVKGHWRRNPGTAVIENNQEVSRRSFN